MDSKPIYEILMLEKPITVDEFGWPHYGRSENVGFYFEQEKPLILLEIIYATLMSTADTKQQLFNVKERESIRLLTKHVTLYLIK